MTNHPGEKTYNMLEALPAVARQIAVRSIVILVMQQSSVSRIFPLFALLALAGLAACRAKPALTPQQAEGQRVYDVGCAHCHEENDLRLKKVPPDLHGVFSKDRLPDGEPATDAAVERILINGKGMMPSFEYQMTPEQMAALLAYLHAGIRKP